MKGFEKIDNKTRCNYPLDTGSELDVQITSWMSSKRLMYVQFNAVTGGRTPIMKL